MNRLVLGVVLVSILIPSSVWAADVTTKTTRSETNKIEIYGDVGLKAVFREDFFDRLFPRRIINTPAPWPAAHSEIFGTPDISLTFEGRLRDEIGAVLTLGLVPGAYGAEAPLFGRKDSFLYLEEAYVYAKEFLGKYTALYVGEKNVVFDLRENGDEFFCNILESENPFTGAVHTDPLLTGMPASVSGVWAPGLTASVPAQASPSGMHWNPFMGGNAWFHNYANQAKHSTFAGMQIEWVLSREKTGTDPFKVDFAVGMILETLSATTDTVFFVARPLATFDITGTDKHLSRVQAILAMISGDSDTAIGSLGVGFSVKPLGLLEVFGEYMGQFGEYTSAQRPSALMPTYTGDDLIHQGAHAVYGGIRVEPEIKIQKELSITPFAEISFWWIGGDRGDPWQSNHDYVSFEDVDTFLIMEDNDFGLDVDANYNAIKSEIGVRFETFELSVLIGSFRLNFAPHQDVYGKPANGNASYSRLLGNEVDVKFGWSVKESVKVRLGAAFLTDAFFWNETVKARNIGIAPGRGTGTNAAMVVTELQLKF